MNLEEAQRQAEQLQLSKRQREEHAKQVHRRLEQLLEERRLRKELDEI